jgi:hypothetical protein
VERSGIPGREIRVTNCHFIDRITDFLFDKGEKSQEKPKYPYVLSPSFLSPAEQNFFSVLKTTVAD